VRISDGTTPGASLLGSLEEVKSTQQRPSWRQPLLLDIALACLVTLLTLLGTLEAARQHGLSGRLDALGWAILAIGGAALVGVRRMPLATLGVAALAHASYIILSYPEGAEYLPTVVAIAGAAAAGFRWAALLVALAGVSSMVLYRALEGTSAWLDTEVLLTATGVSSAILGGEWIRARRAYIASTVQRARLAELGREKEARRRVDEERLRIAREMHDVLAHALASINVQAGVTLHVIKKHPKQAEEALKSIKSASAQALSELRTTVGSLRGDDEGTDRLERLDTLLEPARNAGLQVRVHSRGRRYKLPAQLDLAAYRILQESITNSIRHAGPAQLTITLDYEPDRVRIRVEDDGHGFRAAETSNGTGRGIAGMRERAVAVGGTVEAGPLGDRGFAVRAVLPVQEGSG